MEVGVESVGHVKFLLLCLSRSRVARAWGRPNLPDLAIVSETQFEDFEGNYVGSPGRGRAHVEGTRAGRVLFRAFGIALKLLSRAALDPFPDLVLAPCHFLLTDEQRFRKFAAPHQPPDGGV